MGYWTGALGRPDLNTEQLKQSKSDKAVFLEPANHPFLTLMTDRAQKEPKKDVEFTTFSRPYPIQSGMAWGITVATGAKLALTTTATDVYIANAASFLRVGDLLKINGLQANIATAGYKTILGEIWKVTGTPSTNHATVERNVGGGTAVDCSGTGATDGLTWRFAGEAEPLGGASRTPKGLTIGDRINYIQSFCEPYAQVDIMEKIDYYGPDTLKTMREDAMIRISDAIEHMMVYGQKRKFTDALGRPVYMSGGLQYWLNQTDTEEGVAAWTAGPTGTDLVVGDGTSRIWCPQANITLQLIGQFMTRAFRFGNRTKLGLHGERFLPIWEAHWGDKIQIEQKVTDYGITINSHTANGMKINFVYCPVMDTEDPTGLFLVDLPYVALAVINDIHPRDEIQEKKSRTKDYDYIADVGFDGQFLKAHAYIKDLNDIV